MADETTGVQVAAGNAADQESAAPPEQKFDAEYVKGLRAEAARYRTEAQAAKAKVTEYETAQLTEAQKLQAQTAAALEAASQAQTQLRLARADAALTREAAKAGVNPALLGRLVDVQFDDNGNPVDVDKALAAVLKEYPQLKPVQVAGMSTTNPGRPGPKLTIEEIKRMTPAEVNDRWTEVEAALTANNR